jgi:hypothetical protein
MEVTSNLVNWSEAWLNQKEVLVLGKSGIQYQSATEKLGRAKSLSEQQLLCKESEEPETTQSLQVFDISCRTTFLTQLTSSPVPPVVPSLLMKRQISFGRSHKARFLTRREVLRLAQPSLALLEQRAARRSLVQAKALRLGPNWLVDQLSAISIRVVKPYSTSMARSASQVTGTFRSFSSLEEDDSLKAQSLRLYAKVFWPLNPVAELHFGWTAYLKEVEK